MSGYKSKIGILGVSVVMAMSLGLVGCGGTTQVDNNEVEENTVEQIETTNENSVEASVLGALDLSLFDFSYTEREIDPSFDTDTAVRIDCSADGVEISSEGVALDEHGNIVVSAEGVYVLSGQYTGTVIVDVPDTEKVQLVLNNIELTGTENAIKVLSADKVFLTLNELTVNTVSNQIVASGDEGNDAAIWVDTDLVIQGEGILNLTSVADGIKSQDDLTITGGNITVEAADDAIVGHDSLKIKSTTLKASAVGDVLKSSQTDKEGKGFISIDSGNFELISSGDDGISSSVYTRIAGGAIVIKAEDKGITSDNGFGMSDGSMNIVAKGDGIHADYFVNIDFGSIDVIESNEGIEAQVITINDGMVNIKSQDDGLNASTASNSDEDTDKQFNKDPFGDVDKNCAVVINGGRIEIDAQGDGVDSNGTVEFNGGDIYINGPSNDGNAALDSGIGAYSNGGNVIAIGSSGMFESFDQTSIQAFIEADVEVAAGDEIVITSDGDEKIRIKASKTARKLTVSWAGLEVGTEATVQINGQDIATITATDQGTGTGMPGFERRPNDDMAQSVSDGQEQMAPPEGAPQMKDGETPPEPPIGEDGRRGPKPDGQHPDGGQRPELSNIPAQQMD